MNKRQKEVELAKLKAEEQELKHLKAIYNKAADDIANKLKISNGKINVLLKDFDNLDDVQKSILQSQIYQRNFQLSLKKQIDGFLSDLKSDQYKSIDEYLKKSYETGFLGTMYDLHGQGIPLVMPIDQKKVAAAIKLDPKISKNLYTKLGEDVAFLKKRIVNNIARGIATADSFSNIARNIASASNVGFNRAMRIARTEGHRVQIESANDAQHDAKDAGADVVKQWDAALDDRTRESHAMVDGEIRELDETFSNGMMYPSDPSGGAAEVVNCRCALLQRAKWALDEDELQTLKDRAEYYGLDKTKNFEEFKEKYKIATDEFDITEGGKYTRLNFNNVDDYANYIGDEFAAQNMSVKDLRRLWEKDGGYIQSQGYTDINNFLRGLKNKLDNSKCGMTMRIMQRLTHYNSLQKAYIGIRKVDMSYLENVIGLNLNGMTKRSFRKNALGGSRPTLVPKDKDAAQRIADAINGMVGTEKGTIPDKAFTSVSLNEKLNYFKHYPIKFEIQMPKGTKGIITNNLPESEFIAKNGSAIEIIKAEVYNDNKDYCVKIYARMKQ